MENTSTDSQDMQWDRIMETWPCGKTAVRHELARLYVEEFPNYGPGWVVLADAYTRFAQYKKARAALRRAEPFMVGRLPHYIPAELGSHFVTTGDWKLAEEWLRKAIELKLDSRALTDLGELLRKQGRFTEAKGYLLRALEVESRSTEYAYFELGQIQRAEGKYEEALAAFEQALATGHDKAEVAALDCRDTIRLQASTAEEQSQEERRDCIREPHGPACSYELALDYTNDYPDCGHGWVAFAEALRELSRAQEAHAALEKAESLWPEERWAFLWCKRGQIDMRSGQLQRAEKWLLRSVKADSSHPSPACFLGALYATWGQHAKAEIFYRKSIELNPKTADEPYFNIGLLHRAHRKYEEAIDCFDKAIAIDPDYALAIEARVDCLEALPFLD